MNYIQIKYSLLNPMGARDEISINNQLYIKARSLKEMSVGGGELSEYG